VLYRFDRQPADGIVQPAACFYDDHVELISPEGNLQAVAYADLKAICFVSDAGSTDLFTTHPFFDRRPKAPGLWTRFTFRDGDQLDGVLAHNILEWPAAGYFITPPHAGANRQRAFLPRVALVNTELRGVVGTSAQVLENRRKPEVLRPGQLSMFD
jgi:hypothetical protein